MNADEVMAEFRAAGALREGHFVLSSGLHSPVFLQAVHNSFVYTGTATVCKLALGLAMALVLNQHFPFKNVIRARCCCRTSCRPRSARWLSS